jgi:hypothetical protein
MVGCTGSITLNGITDSELVKILEFKVKHEGKFTFNPQTLQIVPNRPPAQETVYNNAIFHWQNEEGLRVVHEIMGYLLKKEERREAVAQ